MCVYIYISEDNAEGCKIVRKMNSWPRSEALMATEILRTIFQLRALSSDMPASWKGVYLFYNPSNNFSRRTHSDRSCIFFVFFLCVSRYGVVNQLFIYPSLASAKSFLNVCSFLGFASVEKKVRRGYQIGRRISSNNHRPILYHVINFI